MPVAEVSAQGMCRGAKHTHLHIDTSPSTPTHALTWIQAHPLTHWHQSKHTHTHWHQSKYMRTNLGVWKCGVLTECGHCVCSWRELKWGSQRKLMKKCVVTAALATPSSPIAQRSVLATHMQTPTHACMNTCMHTHMHTQMHAQTYTQMHARTYADMYTHTCMHTYVYSHIHTYTWMHTYTHTHTPTQENRKQNKYLPQTQVKCSSQIFKPLWKWNFIL